MSEYTYHKLSSGLAIYKQKGSKNYYARIRLKSNESGSREFRRSLRTDNFDDASRAAWGLLFAYENQTTPDFFVPTSDSRVSSLASSLTPIFEANKKDIYSDYKRVLDEFSKKYGSLLIKDVDKATLREYITEHAKSTTQLRIRKTMLKHLFNHAVEKRIMKEYQIPSVPSVEVEPDESRAMFSPEHANKILFGSEYLNWAISYPKQDTKDYRFMMRYYMDFLNDTGVRPGEEALNIRFSDISYVKSKNIYSLKINAGKIHSKSKSSFREIALGTNSIRCIESLLNRFYSYGGIVRELHNSPKVDSSNFIFRLPNKQNVKPQYEKMFEVMCEYLGIDKKSLDYSLYSFRHTYITRKLVEGTDAYLVATHCGTSVEMLHKNYSKLTSVMRSSEIVGDFEGEGDDILPF